MGSGKRRAPAEGRGGLPFRGLLALAALLLVACSAGDFPTGLSELDSLLSTQAPPKKLSAAFSRLYGRASSASDWISLAKRSPASEELGDGGRNLTTASRVVKALPASEPAGRSAAWLFLRAGAPRKALALFGGSLDPEAHPGLWAEAVLAVGSGEGPGLLGQSGLARLAKATGDASWYEEAALLALKAGDRFSAEAWLKHAIDRGREPDPLLLWDAGLFGPLVDQVMKSSRPDLLALGGDAAWRAGEPAKAAALWKRAYEGEMDPTWMLRVDLALLAPRGQARVAAARSLAASAAGQPEARRYAALLLVDEGLGGEASRLLSRPGIDGAPLPAALALELGGGQGAEDRLVASFLRLGETWSGSGAAAAVVQRLLLQRGRYEEFLQLHAETSGKGLVLPDAWFYAMMAKTLQGSFDEARALAEAEGGKPGAGGEGPVGAYSQALLLAQGGETAAALKRCQAALLLALTARERSTILKEIGALEAAQGSSPRALAAYRAALAADPSDGEALVLAKGKPGSSTKENP